MLELQPFFDDHCNPNYEKQDQDHHQKDHLGSGSLQHECGRAGRVCQGELFKRIKTKIMMTKMMMTVMITMMMMPL